MTSSERMLGAMLTMKKGETIGLATPEEFRIFKLIKIEKYDPEKMLAGNAGEIIIDEFADLHHD